jgi:anti-anti-sigma factor
MPDADNIISERQKLDDGMLVRVHGDIDFSRSPSLRAQLLEVLHQGPSRLVIDLMAVDYMDSSGVATLVEALQAQRKGRRKLVLCNLQPKVKGIFQISKLDTVFTIAESAEAAATA